MAAVELNTTANDVISTSNARDVKVKYRWYRTIETKSNTIQLTLPFNQTPVELNYIGTGNGVDAYESADVVVPCGTHKGCRLLIDDVDYQLEPFDVKHYSFEIHVYIEDDDQLDIDQLNDVTGHVTAIDSSYVESAVCQQQQYRPKSAGDDINVMDDVIVEDDVPPAPSQPTPQKQKTSSVASGVCTPNTATSRSRCSSGSTSRRLSRLENLLRQQIADKDTVTAPAVTTCAETGSSNDGQSAPPPPMRAALLPSRSSLASGPRYDWLGTGLDEARTAISSTRVTSGSVDRLATPAAAGSAQGQQWQPPPSVDASNALMSRSRSVESIVSAAGTTYSMTTGLPPPVVKQPTDLDSLGAKRQHQQQQVQQLNGSISQSLSGLNNIDDDDNDDDDASDDTATLMTPMTTHLRPEVGYYVDQQTDARKQPITSATGSFSPISSSTRQNSISAPVLAGIGTTDRNYQTSGDSASRGVGSSSVISIDKVNPVKTINIPHQASGSEVLLRKINELENHLADVQEANRTTLAKLKASERTIAELQQENDLLRQATGSRRIQQLEEENQSLRTQLQIAQQTTTMSTAGDSYTSRDGGAWSSLHAEVRQLRDELNNLRDDNRRLVQSNQMLMMQRFGADVKPMNGVYDNDRGRSEDIKQSQSALDKRNEPTVSNWLNENSCVTGGLDHSSHHQSSGRGVWYDSLDKFAARQPTSGMHDAGHVTANNVTDGSWAPANQTKRSENVTATSSTFDIYLPNYSREEIPFNQRTGRSQSTDRMSGRLGDRNQSTGYHKSSQPTAADCSVLSSSSVVVRDQSSRPASGSGLRYTDGGGPRPAVKRPDGALFPSSGSDLFDAEVAQRVQPQQQQQQQQQQQLDGLPPRPVRQTNHTHNAAAVDHRSTSVAVGVEERSPNRQLPSSNPSQTTGGIAARLTSLNPASKRLSISSTSTESILQEADWMLDVVRQAKPSAAVNAAAATAVPSSTAVAAQTPASRATLEQTSSRLQQQVVEDRRQPDERRNIDRISRADRIEPYVSVTTSLQTSARPSRHTFIETPTVSGMQQQQPQQQQQQQQPLTRSADFTNSRDNSFVTNAKRPFAPRSPTDVSIGDDVKFLRQGGKISKGRVKYIGHLPDKRDVYLGIELEQELGKHDGVFNGQRIFQCQPNRGVFVAFSKVIMAWCD